MKYFERTSSPHGLLLALSIFLGTSISSAGSAAIPDDRTHQKVAVLMFEGVDTIDYAGPMEVFGYSSGIDDVYTVAATKKPIITNTGMVVTPKYSFADAPQPDVILIPGGNVSTVQNDPATLKWIKSKALHASYTMSVCNGAFTLANTGLLDGLKATTTAYWLPSFRTQYPKISVVRDQRVVDNGKILTTGGLTAGIDGALHVISKMFGEGRAQAVALTLEYNYSAQRGYAPAMLAYNFIPTSMSLGDDLAKLGKWDAVSTEGTNDHWVIVKRVITDLTANGLLDAVGKIYAAAGDWTNVHNATDSPTELASAWKYGDKDGKAWTAILTVQPTPSESHQYTVKLSIARTADDIPPGKG